MTTRQRWTRDQLLVAFALYSRLSFGKLHRRNPEVIQTAAAIGRTPSALAMKLTNIASLDPDITSTGRTGLRGASNRDRDMWDEMHSDWENFAVASSNALASATGVNEAEHELDNQTGDHSGRERLVEVKARIGQEFFRNAVLSAYSEQCCITGLSVPTLLRAGHIVPWSVDPHNRVNPKNGLLLSILHERAFDAGLFTISDKFRVVVSQTHGFEHDAFYTNAITQYHGQPIRLPRKFAPDRKFLAYHQEHVFCP